MAKTKQAILQQLKKDYEAACNGYLAELLCMWELVPSYIAGNVRETAKHEAGIE